MASEHTVTKVLLEWINSFSLGKTLRAADELTDGVIVWEVLQDIDPQYFLDELPERNNTSDHWVNRWQNLKHIHKLVISYIRYQNDDRIPSGLDPSPDLEAVAEKNSAKETNKLLKLLLIAAISSPNAATYVTAIQDLETSTQEVIKDIIEEAHNGQHEPVDAADEIKDDSKRDVPVDLELQFEERVGKVLAENDRLTHEKKELEKALEDLHNRLARLQENNDTLQNRLASTEDRLVTLKSGKGDIGFNAKALETKTRHQEDIIASQEARIAATQDELDSLRMSVETLRVKNQRFQTLQDDYDELKTEKDQLARKANAAEKYRQKLQASQDFEKENQTLKNQIKDLQQQLKEADSTQRWTSERDVELEEYRRVLPRIEQECSEMQNLKKQLEFNNHALTERLEGAEEQRERDDLLISELRERVRELEGSPGSPSLTPGTETPRQETLQKDFEKIGAKESQLKSENDELKKEVESMKVPGASLESGSFESFSDGFAQTVEIAKTNSSQGDEYWKLYDSYTATLKKLAEAQSSLDTNQRALADAIAEKSLIDKGKADIINEVKENDSTESSKLRADWDEIMQKTHNLEAEIDASQALAREVCAERDELRVMLEKKQGEMVAEDQESIKEVKKLLSELTAHDSGDGLDTSEKSVVELMQQLTVFFEKNIDRLAKRAEYIHQQNELIKVLQERIKNFEENDDDGISKERELELQNIIDSQNRELALMSSAWFDLQSRLQSNSVTVSRYRHASSPESQKGWLARQRVVVAGR